MFDEFRVAIINRAFYWLRLFRFSGTSISPLSDLALRTQIRFPDSQIENQHTRTVHWILDWTDRLTPVTIVILLQAETVRIQAGNLLTLVSCIRRAELNTSLQRQGEPLHPSQFIWLLCKGRSMMVYHRDAFL